MTISDTLDEIKIIELYHSNTKINDIARLFKVDKWHIRKILKLTSNLKIETISFIENEIWEIIKDYPNYSVSNLGRVKSFEKIVISKLGIKRVDKSKIIKDFSNGKGYRFVRLTNKEGLKNLYIHRLVAEVFIPNIDHKTDVNHKNGIKSDNTLENLEWCTRSDNIKHAFTMGLKIPVSGENNHKSKLKLKDVQEIRQSDKTIKELSSIYNIGIEAIRKIRNNQSWCNKNK